MKSPVKSIRAFCLSCVGMIPKLVRTCPSDECPLHPYRMGKNPSRTGIGGKTGKRDVAAPADTIEIRT